MIIQLDEVWNVFFSFKGGGVQGEFFGRINTMLWAPQVALFMRETFGEVPGLRAPNWLRATPNPYMGAGNSHMTQMVLEGQMGHQTVLLITQIHSIKGLMGLGTIVWP